MGLDLWEELLIQALRFLLVTLSHFYDCDQDFRIGCKDTKRSFGGSLERFST